MTSITSFLKSKLEAWVTFEELDGLEFKVAYLAREEINKIRDAATSKVYVPKFKNYEEKFDAEKFAAKLVESVVLDWKGLTLEKLLNLAPIDVPEGIDLTTEISYSKEEAAALFSNSPPLELWLTSVVSDLETFRSLSKK